MYRYNKKKSEILFLNSVSIISLPSFLTSYILQLLKECIGFYGENCNTPCPSNSMDQNVKEYATVQKMRLVISLLAVYQTSHVVRSDNDTISVHNICYICLFC